MIADGSTVVLIGAKTATLVFGGLLTFLSYRAFRRTGSSALRALAVGIGLLTVGALVGGALHQLTPVGLGASVGIQSVFTAIGFGVMTYSLFVDVSDYGDRIGSGTRTGEREPKGDT